MATGVRRFQVHLPDTSLTNEIKQRYKYNITQEIYVALPVHISLMIPKYRRSCGNVEQV